MVFEVGSRKRNRPASMGVLGGAECDGEDVVQNGSGESLTMSSTSTRTESA